MRYSRIRERLREARDTIWKGKLQILHLVLKQFKVYGFEFVFRMVRKECKWEIKRHRSGREGVLKEQDKYSS